MKSNTFAVNVPAEVHNDIRLYLSSRKHRMSGEKWLCMLLTSLADDQQFRQDVLTNLAELTLQRVAKPKQIRATLPKADAPRVRRVIASMLKMTGPYGTGFRQYDILMALVNVAKKGSM